MFTYMQNVVREVLQLPDVVDLDTLLSLACVRDANDGYCFYELEAPLLLDDHDPVSS